MRQLFLAMAMLGGLTLAASAANATLVVQTGNHPQIDDNVINNACNGEVDGPALTVKGCLNTNHDQLVDFTSDENIKFDSGGQAVIVSADGNGFSTLTIAVEGHQFDTLILNIDAIKQSPDKASEVQFTDGTTTSALFALDPNGNNFFTLTGGPFPFITFTVFDASNLTITLDDTDHVKQVRIGGREVPIPEPATVALIGIGLVGLGLMRRRREAPI